MKRSSVLDVNIWEKIMAKQYEEEKGVIEKGCEDTLGNQVAKDSSSASDTAERKGI